MATTCNIHVSIPCLASQPCGWAVIIIKEQKLICMVIRLCIIITLGIKIVCWWGTGKNYITSCGLNRITWITSIMHAYWYTVHTIDHCPNACLLQHEIVLQTVRSRNVLLRFHLHWTYQFFDTSSHLNCKANNYSIPLYAVIMCMCFHWHWWLVLHPDHLSMRLF